MIVIKRLNIKVVFFGTSEFALRPLEELLKNFKLTAVITKPDAPAGRKKILTPPPVKTFAQKLGVAVLQPEKLSAMGGIPTADLYVVAAYGKLIPKEIYELPRFKTVNIHPSLLPRWRGPSPIQCTILNGDEITGVSIMLIDEKMDHGPIVANHKLQITNHKITAPELSNELSELGAKLLIKTIPKWINGEIEPVAQDESKAIYGKLLKKEDGKIDWKKSAVEIERQIRAFQPWPGSYTSWNKKDKQIKLEVVESNLMDTQIGAGIPPGTVKTQNGKLFIATTDGFLDITKIQPEGKRIMDIKAFLNGYGDIDGVVLG